MSFMNKKSAQKKPSFKSGAMDGGIKSFAPKAKPGADGEKKGFSSGGTVQEATSKGMRGTGAAQRGTKTRGYVGSD